jgi:hypothetical protein
MEDGDAKEDISFTSAGPITFSSTSRSRLGIHRLSEADKHDIVADDLLFGSSVASGPFSLSHCATHSSGINRCRLLQFAVFNGGVSY